MTDTRIMSYTSERPKLPAAFLAPQTCPPGRCRFPGVPLPPPSPIILAALTKAYFAQMRRQLVAGGCNSLIVERDWDTTIAGARIMELALAGFSPDEIVAKVGSKEERARTEQTIRRTWSNDKELFLTAGQMYLHIAHSSMAGSSDFVRIDLARMMNGREYEIVVNSEWDPLCLHDVLNPENIEEWTALLDVHQIYPLSERPQIGKQDREPLYRKINAAASIGEIAGSGWESPVVWRSKVKIAADAYYLMMGELAMELFSQDRLIGMARQALEELGSALPLVAHMLFRPSTDRKATSEFLQTSPEIHQFDTFVRQIYNPASRHLATDFPELDEFLPQPVAHRSPLDISLPPPSPAAPDKTFRKTKMVKNDSEFFWFILKRVEPRCCAPDRCSGRTPATINNPSAPDYARVESAITSIFLGCFLAEIQETGIYPKQVCEIVLKATSTLECETADDRFNLLPLFESISHEYVTCEDSQKAAPHDFVQAALRMLYDKIKSSYRRATGENRFPCLCDLVNNVDAIEALDEEIKECNERRQAKRLPRRRIEIVATQRWAAQQIRTGGLRGDCWKGEDWKEKIIPFLHFFDDCIEVLCIGHESRLAMYERFRQLFRVMGSARILEEAIEWSAQRPGDDFVTRHLDTFVGMTYETDFFEIERQDNIKISADQAMLQGRDYLATVSLQKLSILAKPVGSWSARLNSAAQRLRLANPGSQFHQYSMAIQDCTMALYYCPPKFKFKAYYRRGIALARLQLWKKAILDLEQALLIEPQNPLIKQELAAARKKL